MASKDALRNLEVIVDDVVDPNWMEKMEIHEKDIKDKKTNKKKISVYNPSNKKINKTDIIDILTKYNICISKGTNVNYRLFQEAMTHKSYLKKKKLSDYDKKKSVGCVKLQNKSNDRLQFLGDSIIHFVIGELLYDKYSENDEGFLTRLRSKIENKRSIYFLSKKSNIYKYVLVSQNIEISHGRKNVNILGGGFEAFVGALYITLGFDQTRKFIMEIIDTEIDIDETAKLDTNYKDLILQIYNEKRWGNPDYKLIDQYGPDHEKIFVMGIYLDNKLMGKGSASSKKQAEQIAAEVMYKKLSAKN